MLGVLTHQGKRRRTKIVLRNKLSPLWSNSGTVLASPGQPCLGPNLPNCPAKRATALGCSFCHLQGGLERQRLACGGSGLQALRPLIATQMVLVFFPLCVLNEKGRKEGAKIKKSANEVKGGPGYSRAASGLALSHQLSSAVPPLPCSLYHL